MYFQIKPINNNTYYNRESLELIKNLQSLGVSATGRLSTDRQTLQVAEYQKLKQTLAPTNEQKIQNAETPFSAIMQTGSVEANNNPTTQATQAMQAQSSTNSTQEIAQAVENKTGATQLAELKKYQLGLAA